MKLVAGLGNPGSRYAQSRHNMGFRVVEALARRWNASLPRYEADFQGLLAEAQVGDARVLLLQPQTFMNESGRSVAAVWRYYRLTLPDLLVVMDDLDLPLGQVRLRAEGSAGGHKGLADVIRHLSDDQFPRLRIGIGKVDPRATVEYVLGRFDPHEQPLAEQAVTLAADAVDCWLTRGLAAAMNAFNRKPDGQAPAGPSPANGPAKGDGL